MLDVVCKILLFCKVYIRVIFVKNTSKINTTSGDERKKKKKRRDQNLRPRLRKYGARRNNK